MQKLELIHTTMSEPEALRLLDGHRISRGGRTMDPKAQIVGEFVKSIRVPGYFPPLPELRQQLRTMVRLMDVPAPPLARIEDIRVPGPAGPLPARAYEGARGDGGGGAPPAGAGAHLSRARLRPRHAVASRPGGCPHHPARPHPLVRGPVSAGRHRSAGSTRLAAARAEPRRSAADVTDHRRLR